MSNDEEWSKDISELAVDALVDAGLIEKTEFKRASEIIAEEIFVRLLLKDRPIGDGTEQSE